MDRETEGRLAALIMEEAARLKLQAETEGVHAYLLKPKIRSRPNPHFLKATVRGVEQANRAAEVNEMWKRRSSELDLEKREKDRSREKHKRRSPRSSSQSCYDKEKRSSRRNSGRHHEKSSSPRLHVENVRGYAVDEVCGGIYDKEVAKDSHHVIDDLRDEGLKEDEVEHFLHSRVKRGRGAVGSRMDEPGPYPLPHTSYENVPDMRTKEDWEDRIVGPLPEVDVSESKKHKKKKQKIEDPEESSSKIEKKRKDKHKYSHKRERKR